MGSGLWRMSSVIVYTEQLNGGGVIGKASFCIHGSFLASIKMIPIQENGRKTPTPHFLIHKLQPSLYISGTTAT